MIKGIKVNLTKPEVFSIKISSKISGSHFRYLLNKIMIKIKEIPDFGMIVGPKKSAQYYCQAEKLLYSVNWI